METRITVSGLLEVLLYSPICVLRWQGGRYKENTIKDSFLVVPDRFLHRPLAEPVALQSWYQNVNDCQHNYSSSIIVALHGLITCDNKGNSPRYLHSSVIYLCVCEHFHFRTIAADALWHKLEFSQKYNWIQFSPAGFFFFLSILFMIKKQFKGQLSIVHGGNEQIGMQSI